MVLQPKLSPGLSKVFPQIFSSVCISLQFLIPSNLVPILPDSIFSHFPRSTLVSSPFKVCIHYIFYGIPWPCILYICPGHCSLLSCIITSQWGSLNSSLNSLFISIPHTLFPLMDPITLHDIPLWNFVYFIKSLFVTKFRFCFYIWKLVES